MPYQAPARREDPRVTRSRAAVLDAATELLLAAGLDALTVDAVLTRSGVARSTFYRHWPSRAELLAEVFRRLMPDVAAPPPPGPLHQRLVAIALHAAGEMRAPETAPMIVNLLQAAHFDPELSGFCDRYTREKRAPLLAVLADARTAGELREDVTDDDAASLLIDPLFLRAVMTHQPVQDTWVRGHVDRVHRAVGAS